MKDSLSAASKVTQLLTEKQKGLNRTLQEQIANQGPASYIAHLTRQYEEQGRVIDKLAKKTTALKSIKQQLKASESHRSELRGKLMETVGLGYMAARPVSIGVEFEYAMSKVQALTRLDKESPEMKALNAQARELGAKTMFSSTEAAQAQGFLAMAGFNPDQIMKSMPSVLDMAKAGDLDLQRTADIASNIQTAYGLAAEQMPRIADTLTMAFTTSNVSLEMLSQTMKYMGPAAKEAKMSLEEASAMAGLLGNAGIQADQAGTALRNTISRLAKPPKAAADALKELGVKTADAKGQLRSVPEILLDIAEKSKKLGSAKRIGLFTDIFGARAAPGLMAMLGSPEKIKPYIDIVKNSAGAAQKTAKIMGDNTKGKLDELTSAWEDMNIALFETGKIQFNETLQSITKLIDAVSGFVQRNPEFVGTILKIVTALIAFRAGLLVAQYGLSLLGLPFLQIISFGLKMHTVFLLFKSAGFAAAFPKIAIFVNVLTTALGFLKTALIALKAVVIAHPVIALLVLLAATAYLLYSRWDAIKEGWPGFIAFLNDLKPAIKGILMLATTLGGVFLAAKIAIGGLGAGIAIIMSPIGAIALLMGALLFIWYRWDAIKEGWPGFVAMCKDAFFALCEAVGKLISFLTTLFVNFSLFGLIYRAFAAVLNWLGFDVPPKLSDVGLKMIEGLWAGLKAGWETVKNWFGSLGDWMTSTLRKDLQVKSPSRVFMEIGGYTMAGLEQGLIQNATGSLEAIKKHAGAIAAAGTLALSAPALAVPPVPDLPLLPTLPALELAAPNLPPLALPDAANAITPQSPPPLSAPALAAPSASGFSGAGNLGNTTMGAITINVHPSPGMDEKALAELVAQKIAEARRIDEASRHSRLSDRD